MSAAPGSSWPAGSRSTSIGCRRQPNGWTARVRWRSGWTRCATGIDQLTRVVPDDNWQLSQVHREFAEVAADAGPLAETPLKLPDVRALLSTHLAGRPSRASFRTGTLTVCTMVPMRSVPHRVVCLLGLDDGVFPRFGLADGDDLLARSPITGERDVRSEDRQLLLDAILAATESLVITYTGANEYSGQRRPPAVPLGELLDVLDRTTETTVREAVLIKHPLQPFDRKNLEAGRLGTPGPFTFDPTALVAARAAAGSRPARPEFLAGQLAVASDEDIALADLLAFFRHPVRGYFRALDLTLPWEVDGVSDVMPVEIDNLQKWSVGDRLLRDMLSGVNPNDALQAEWRRGTLPPGRLGWRTATDVRDEAKQLAIAAHPHRQVSPRAFDLDIDLGGGRRLTGTVPSVHGYRLVSVSFSRLDAKQLLSCWIQLLALSANDDDHNWTALAIGRGRNSPADQALRAGRTGSPCAAGRPGRDLRRRSAGAAAASPQDLVRLVPSTPHRRRSGDRGRATLAPDRVRRGERRPRPRPGLGSLQPARRSAGADASRRGTSR